MPSRDDVARAIQNAILETLKSKGLESARLDLDTPVDRTLGLDSLDWAAVVVQLEGDLGADPFTQGVDRELRTVSDLVDVYEQALA